MHWLAINRESISAEQLQIVQPILVRLIESQGGREDLKSLLLQLLRIQQDQAPLQPGYFAGNAINLLCQIGAESASRPPRLEPLGYSQSRLIPSKPYFLA